MTQLNMGMGKTRVIIPLLLLHLCLRRRGAEGHGHITRLTLPRALLDEARLYLHANLTAGVFGIRFVSVPYSRDITRTSNSP